jgi:exopolysaccharide biosynthesis predicted pyruvyltransferase EpsI
MAYKPEKIKKIYESHSQSQNKEIDNSYSFIQTKSNLRTEQSSLNPTHKILANKILIDYPHYGNVGQQVIFNKIPEFINKTYNSISS